MKDSQFSIITQLPNGKVVRETVWRLGNITGELVSFSHVENGVLQLDKITKPLPEGVELPELPGLAIARRKYGEKEICIGGWGGEKVLYPPSIN